MNKHKQLEKELDKLWSQLVKNMADFRCEVCGDKESDYIPIDSHHIVKRTHKALRWTLSNGLCVDRTCHRVIHDKPELFEAWLEKHRAELLEELNKHKGIKRYSLGELETIRDDFKAQLKQMSDESIPF